MAEALKLDAPLVVGNLSTHNTGLWGVWALIVTEGSLFLYLLTSYAYLSLTGHQTWPPDGLPELLKPGISTIILLLSSGVVFAAEKLLEKGRRNASLLVLAIAFVMGVVFVAMQAHEWGQKPYTPATHLYGSLYFTITGFHMAHVVVGLGVLACLWLWIALRRIAPGRMAPLRVGGLYWHFVDAVWIAVFSTLYLIPYLHV